MLAIAGWATLALVTASQGYVASLARGAPQSWAATFGYTAAFYAVWAVLTPPIAWLTRRVPLNPGSAWRFTRVHVPAGIVAAALQPLLFTLAFASLYGGGRSWLALWRAMLIGSFHTNLVLYALLALGLAGAALYRRSRDRRLREAELEARLARAELAALRTQLHPHFLFNTLNAISALVRDEPARAEQLVARLGELLRLTIDSGELDEVPLADELERVDAYLEIEQARLGDRLRVARAIEPAALALAVPHLVILPLVENAIRHAIAPRAAGGELSLAIRVEGDQLSVEVRDDGDGAAAIAPTGVGLGNTRARLAHLYGDAHAFEIDSGPGRGFAVRLTLPARRPERADRADAAP